jgi:CheY-like chemotaxis protein
VARAAGTRVLVVDDHCDSAELLSEVLTANGCDVRVALDGEEALAIVREFAVDLAFIDIGLPATTGHELIRALRALPQMASCRYVAVSGYDTKAAIQQSFDAGFELHLVKPVAIAEIVAAVAKPASGSGPNFGRS